MAQQIHTGLFITATDTGAGKTRTTTALMAALQQQGLKVAGMKPVATGCRQSADGLRNADALSIQSAASVPAPYRTINPYAFGPPIAPHLAALDAGVAIDIDRIAEAYAVLSRDSDMVLVEGVGGWRVPLGRERFLVDLVRALKLPVVLVVGLRLGCINHALLSAEAIVADGIILAGWVANQLDPAYSRTQETIETLSGLITAPLLARLPFLTTPGAVHLAEHINVVHLLR